MASNIKYTMIDEVKDLEQLADSLKDCERIAFDSESVKLGRNFPISLASIAFEDGSIFLIDVQKLGLEPLRPILESFTIMKVMFDCRSDSDCLKYQHNIELNGVEDMQVMDYVINHPDLKPAERVSSFVSVVSNYLGFKTAAILKNLNLRDNGSAEWARRPLKEIMLKYASLEISCFFPVRAKLMKIWVQGQANLEEWSKMYVLSRREDPSFNRDDRYKCHRYMPLNMLEKAPEGNTVCTGCHTSLARSQFSQTQLRRGIQKCVVCKAIEARK